MSRGVTAEVDHHFRARGVASLVRLLRDASVEWSGKQPLTVRVPPGTRIASDQGEREVAGTRLVVQPHGRIRVRASYAGPAFLVSAQRVLESIRTHFVLDVRLQSGWHDNLWPGYLDFYLAHRRWPDSAQELGPIFATLLRRGSNAEQTRAIRVLPWRRRLRHGVRRAVIARVGRGPTARGLAYEHWKTISRTFFNHADFAAMVRAAALARELEQCRRGCAVLKATWEEDRALPVMPPMLALAERLEITGIAGIEMYDERRDRRTGHVTVRDAEVTPGGCVGFPGPVTVDAALAHVCLVAGRKRAYALRMPAPIICKGEGFHGRAGPNPLSWWRRVHHWQARWRDADWEPPDGQDPRHLRVRGEATEA